MSIISEIKHHDIDESKDTWLQESCKEEVEPTNLEYDDDILHVEYESFSYGLDANEDLDVDYRVEYGSFSFDSISSDHILEKSKSKFVESEAIWH